jgi:hypothetical protein
LADTFEQSQTSRWNGAFGDLTGNSGDVGEAGEQARSASDSAVTDEELGQQEA